jgi:hypothetical protein
VLASAQVDLSTVALVVVQVARHAATLARVRAARVLANAQVAPSTAALVSAAVALRVDRLANARAALSAQVRLAASEVMSAAVVPALLSQVRGADVRIGRAVVSGVLVLHRTQHQTRAVLHAGISRIAKAAQAAMHDAVQARVVRVGLRDPVAAELVKIAAREALIADPERHVTTNSALT